MEKQNRISTVESPDCIGMQGGWMGGNRTAPDGRNAVLGTAGGHAAVLAHLAGAVLPDPHGAAVFALFA